MATQDTTTDPPTDERNPLLVTRDRKIAEYTKEAEHADSAKARGDKASAASHNAKKANRSAEIGELELDLTIEGVAFDPWGKPRVSKSRMAPLSQEEIEASLAKVVAVLQAKDTPASVKHNADMRIFAPAEERGDTRLPVGPTTKGSSLKRR